MAKLKVYKRNSKFMDLVDLVGEISSIGLVESLEKYYNKPYEKEAKSIEQDLVFYSSKINYFKFKYHLVI